jgi:hypothetical protein
MSLPSEHEPAAGAAAASQEEVYQRKLDFQLDKPRRIQYDLHRIADELKIRVLQHEYDQLSQIDKTSYRGRQIKASKSILDAMRQHADLCHDQLMNGVEKFVPELADMRESERKEAEDLFQGFFSNISIWRTAVVEI